MKPPRYVIEQAVDDPTVRDYARGWAYEHFDESDPLLISREEFADQMVEQLPYGLGAQQSCGEAERWALLRLIHRPERPLYEIVRDTLCAVVRPRLSDPDDWEFAELVAPTATEAIIETWSFPEEKGTEIPKAMADLFRQGIRENGYDEEIRLYEQGKLEDFPDGPAESG